jgi:hypothetical protein
MPPMARLCLGGAGLVAGGGWSAADDSGPGGRGGGPGGDGGAYGRVSGLEVPETGFAYGKLNCTATDLMDRDEAQRKH